MERGLRRDEGVLGKCTPAHTQQKWTFWLVEDFQAICSNKKKVNLRLRRCVQGTLPITYTNSTRISDIEIRRGWPRILNQTWLLTTTVRWGRALVRTCEVLHYPVEYSTAMRLSKCFFLQVFPNTSHRFGETIGILPSTGAFSNKKSLL